MIPVILGGGELWKRKVSCTLGSPSTSEKIGQDKKRALEKNIETGLQQPDWRENCTDGQCCSPALPSLRLMSSSADKFWVLELRIWRSNTRRGLGLDVQKQQGRLESGVIAMQGVHGESPGCLTGQVPLFGSGEVHEGRGGTCHCSLCPCPCVHRRQDTFCTGLMSYSELSPFTWTPGVDSTLVNIYGLHQHICI